MPTSRINKTNNYTVMSKFHLKDERLTLKAKGMLSVLLSLPEDSKYSEEEITKALPFETTESITTTLRELMLKGYLKRSQSKDGTDSVYEAFEEPFQKGE